MSSYKTLNFDIKNQIAYLEFATPESANAMTSEMAQEMAQVSEICLTNFELRAIKITGQGKIFCGGGNVKVFNQEGSNLEKYLEIMATNLHVAIANFARCKAPVISIVQGFAAGAGLSLVGASDFIIASDTAKFTLAYSRIGFSPDGSSSYFLPRIIGIRKMMDLMITNRVLTAEEALDWGLISRVVPEDSLIEEGEKIVESIGHGATAAIGMAKKLLVSTFEQSLESQMALEHLGIATMSRTADCKEGFQAFIDKRDPIFTGS